MAGAAFNFDALPKMQVAAACLFLDEEGRILAVKPTYKPGWEVPGGAAEDGESPLEACRREVLEEIGLDVHPVRLLAIDYREPVPGRRGNALRFVFLGPRLTEDELRRIQLQRAELSEYRFMTPGEVIQHYPSAAARRLEACLENLSQQGTAYLEEGRRVLG